MLHSLRVLALVSCVVLVGEAHGQSVDGEWHGRLECSKYLSGVSGPSSDAFGYGVSVNVSAGVIEGSKVTGVAEERFTGTSDGRRMRLSVDGKRTDRPAWWQVELNGQVRDGTATLQGPMTSRSGAQIRTCSLTLVSSEFRRIQEADVVAKQRELARERREVEVMEAAAKAREDRAQAERAVREAAELKAAAKAAEKRALEIQSAASDSNLRTDIPRGTANTSSETRQPSRAEPRLPAERRGPVQKAATGSSEKAAESSTSTPRECLIKCMFLA